MGRGCEEGGTEWGEGGSEHKHSKFTLLQPSVTMERPVGMIRIFITHTVHFKLHTHTHTHTHLHNIYVDFNFTTLKIIVNLSKPYGFDQTVVILFVSFCSAVFQKCVFLLVLQSTKR